MSDGGKTARSDLVGGAGWIVFGLLILGESLRMDRFAQMGSTLYTMPGFMPGLIGATLIVLGLALCLRGWHRRRLAQTAAAARAGADEPAPPLLNGRVLATLALTLIYAVGLIGRVHFVLATTLFASAFVWTFTPPEVSPVRRAVGAVVAGLLTALAVFFIFEDVFLVRLPGA
ncbi:MAG: tripartite tricarboxylate transporter TctB family protein [Burkholderiaceae bacterium]|nr:tripartite tricarboxylate transporter TctB family protein [Burkholderiaceae bacterium]